MLNEHMPHMVMEGLNKVSRTPETDMTPVLTSITCGQTKGTTAAHKGPVPFHLYHDTTDAQTTVLTEANTDMSRRGTSPVSSNTPFGVKQEQRRVDWSVKASGGFSCTPLQYLMSSRVLIASISLLPLTTHSPRLQ